MIRTSLIFFVAGLNIAFAQGGAEVMARVEGGQLVPFYSKNKEGVRTVEQVKTFLMDRFLVSNRDYLEFLKNHPDWQKSKIKRIFADSGYLEHWDGDLKVNTRDLKKPVRFVSWFAATAYCRSLGRELPTVAQWEYAASADEKEKNAVEKPEFKAKILKWYSRPSIDKLPDVDKVPKNVWGVYGLHGVVWEWTLDFNTALVTGESREDSALNKELFCGSGSLGAKDSYDYAAFMRYGFRSSLKGNYTVGNLGFRCVKN